MDHSGGAHERPHDGPLTVHGRGCDVTGASAGYRLDESTFDTPYFVKRVARLATGSVFVDVVPQASVVTTGPTGLTAPLALVKNDVGDVSGRIALVVAPFGRHAAPFPDRAIGLTVRTAAAAGARAVVIVTTGPTGEAIALNAREQPFVPIPTAVLAPKQSEPFKAAARIGATAMLDAADPERTLMVAPAARRAAAAAFRGLSGLEEPVDVRPGAGELSEFTNRGYDTAFAVLGVHRWLHTPPRTRSNVSTPASSCPFCARTSERSSFSSVMPSWCDSARLHAGDSSVKAVGRGLWRRR